MLLWQLNLESAGGSTVDLSGSTAQTSWVIPAGTLSATSTLAGSTANSTWAIPAGTITVARTLSGSSASTSWTVPAGTTAFTATLSGATATTAWSAASGTITKTSTLAGSTATTAWVIPAGTVSKTATLSGSGATVTWSVAAGAITPAIGLSGSSAVSTWNIPSGTASYTTTLTGTTPTLGWVSDIGSITTAMSLSGSSAQLQWNIEVGSVELIYPEVAADLIAITEPYTLWEVPDGDLIPLMMCCHCGVLWDKKPMTFKQIQDKVLALMDEEGDTSTVLTNVKTLINSAIQNRAGEKKWPFMLSAEMVITIPAGNTTYDLPVDYNAMHWIKDSNNRLLEQIQLEQRFIDGEDSTSQDYLIAGESIKFLKRTAASEEEQYTIQYYKSPPDLVADDDVPCFPSRFHDIFVWDAAIGLKGYHAEIENIEYLLEMQRRAEHRLYNAYLSSADSVGHRVKQVRYAGYF